MFSQGSGGSSPLIRTKNNRLKLSAMTIHLKPELEALIRQDVQRGPYQSADKFVERAVQMLYDHEQ
jgi:hypothetical protein